MHPALDDLRKAFDLEAAASPSEAELEHARSSISGRNRALLDTVGGAVKEELMRVKDALDLQLRTGADIAGLAPQVTQLASVADTLGMMGLGLARNVVLQQRDSLAELVDGRRAAEEGALMDIAGALLYVDASLDDQVTHLGENTAPDTQTVEAQRTVEALAGEAIRNFSEARQQFVAFIETGWDHDQLQDMPRLLGEVGGALRMLELEEPADYLEGVRRYIGTELIQRQRVPGGAQLDTLADAMASLEYYLEALREHRPNREEILGITRSSLETLRYWPLPSEQDAPAPMALAPQDDAPAVQRDATPLTFAPAPEFTADALDSSPIDSADEAPAFSIERAPELPEFVPAQASDNGFDPVAGEFDALAPTAAEEADQIDAAFASDEAALVEAAFEPVSPVASEVESGADVPVAFDAGDDAPVAHEAEPEVAPVFELPVDGLVSPEPPELPAFTEPTPEPVAEVAPSFDAAFEPETIEPESVAADALEAPIDSFDVEAIEMIEATDVVTPAEAIEPINAGNAVEAIDATDVALADNGQLLEGGFDLTGNDIDDEIRDVFLEEFDEEIGNLREMLPAWTSHVENLDRLRPIRRVFHTLKGSGRLVGARLLGEFAWKIENMLNRVLDGSRPASPAVVALLEQATDTLPQLNAALRGHTGVQADLAGIEAMADRVAAGEDVFYRPQATAQAPAAVEAPTEATAAPVFVPDLDGTPASVDSVLREILETEVNNHLQTVDAWLEPALAAGTAVATDPLLRAFHTMNGAFAMADVPEITEITGRAEQYVKRLLANGVAADAAGVAGLSGAAAAIRTAIAALQESQPRIPLFSDLRAELGALRDSLPQVARPVSTVVDDRSQATYGQLPTSPFAPDLAPDVALTGAMDLSHFIDLSSLPDAPVDAASDAAFETDTSPVEAPSVADAAPAVPALPESGDTPWFDIKLDYRAEPRWSESAVPVTDATITLGAPLNVVPPPALPGDVHAGADFDPAPAGDALEAHAWHDASVDVEALSSDAVLPTAGDDQPVSSDIEFADAPPVSSEALEAAPSHDDAPDFSNLDQADLDATALASTDAEADVSGVSLTEPEAAAEAMAWAERVDAADTTGITSGFDAAPAAPESTPQAASETETEAEAEAEAEAFTEFSVAPEAEQDTPSAQDGVDLPPTPAATEAPAMAEQMLDFTLIDRDLVDIFVEEGNDLLDHSDGLLARLRNAPDDRGLVIGLQRDLHTIKGGARMAGIEAIGDLGHAIESLLEQIAEHRADVDRGVIALLERGFDALHGMLARTAAYHVATPRPDLVAEFDARARGEVIAAPDAVTFESEAEVPPALVEFDDGAASFAEPVEAAPAEPDAVPHAPSEDAPQVFEIETIEAAAPPEDDAASNADDAAVERSKEIAQDDALQIEDVAETTSFELAHEAPATDELADEASAPEPELTLEPEPDATPLGGIGLESPLSLEDLTPAEPFEDVEEISLPPVADAPADSAEPAAPVFEIEPAPEALAASASSNDYLDADLLAALDAALGTSYGAAAKAQQTGEPIAFSEEAAQDATPTDAFELAAQTDVADESPASIEPEVAFEPEPEFEAEVSPEPVPPPVPAFLAPVVAAPAVVPQPVAELPALSAPIDMQLAGDDEHSTLSTGQEQVRVRADLLDQLVNHAGEVAIYRARLEQQMGAFRAAMAELDRTNTRLHDQLRRLDLETEAQIVARYQREQDTRDTAFDPLELDRFSTLQQLSRALGESAADISGLQTVLDDLARQNDSLLGQQSRVSSELQDGLMRARMVPFEGSVPRLRRVLRQAAGDTGKQAQLQLEGAHGELDRNVLERMTAPLEHLLRNAVAHGLETPQARRESGKPEEGVVRVVLRREGSEMVLQVADDGAGIDHAAIRRRAEQRGMLPAGAELADIDLERLILEPGFSTAEEVSQLAGRGVGMDVVHNEVRQLGGSLEITSTRGQGTAFTLRLPQTLAVTQAVFVQIGETQFAVPVAAVGGVGRISRERFEAADAAYVYGGEEYALHDLGTLVGQGPAKAEGQPQIPLLLVRAGELRAAVAVDQVLGNREIVVKPVGPQIGSIPGIYGATITGDGSVVVILDAAPLVRRFIAQPALANASVAPAEQRHVPLVMVVDDSLTMRKVTSRVLERHNLEVSTARDGVEALERLEERVPDLMLLDIEMPRMDGYELATAMRADPRFAGVPIVMITSRTGDKHRQRALEIGVQRYMGKPYQELDLMRNVYDLLGMARVRD
ncbi:Hpt domain-containing protein [Pseudoxanthomonas sp. GM95]|uniref:Hpt domain-containing protein n=1 Tax=Pseudoxanthomonas sp. GM95 TaxID=1881043 RepID=UPI0020C891F2|nr:Hpt domain-containing protein [Pseudoxanthomonas sp. GM95]